MNRSIAISVVTGAIIAAIALAQTEKPVPATASPVGRYQIVAAEHDFTGRSGSAAPIRDVFRIDTATGATSFYNAGFDSNGKPYAVWSPIR